MTRFTVAEDINLIIPRRALEVVFTECDRYEADETGGRILGVYEQSAKGLTVQVTGIIEPGPRAERSGTYLMQDGDYQERIFRQVEDRDPAVEHLGNWHTHHVNGLRHLSGGDIDTYRRTVGHKNHNTDFFYALLVIEKHRRATGLERYTCRHYVLRRGDSAVYEIPPDRVAIVEAPLVWPNATTQDQKPRDHAPSAGHHAYGKASTEADGDAARMNRVYDSDAVSQFYPKVKPFQAERLGVYWRGEIPLVDGSEVEAIVLEQAGAQPPAYKVTLRNPPGALAKTVEALSEKSFPSCRAALITSERTCNAELFRERPSGKRRGKWTF
jgi:hypothetical protein